PLAALARRLERRRVLPAGHREALERAVEEELEDAVAFAKASPFPDPAALYADVDGAMKPARALRYREAIDEATRQAMAKDERIVVLGGGVDDAKGIFGTTRGAFEQFGSARVFDTPLSEAALTGIC